MDPNTFGVNEGFKLMRKSKQMAPDGISVEASEGG